MPTVRQIEANSRNRNELRAKGVLRGSRGVGELLSVISVVPIGIGIIMSHNEQGREGPGSGVDREPAAKRQRKLTEVDLGGPIEDEETAREKLEKVGFDPKNVREVKEVSCPDSFGWWYANPICYFAGAGDLKMCRYLVTRGASTRDSASAEYEDGEVSEWFPMLAAAQNGMKNVCEWLYDHGAAGDISRPNSDGDCPLTSALCLWSNPNRDFETAQWLILHSAIPEDKDGKPCASFLYEAFRIFGTFVHPGSQNRFNERKRLLQWAETVCSDHTAFATFLHGTFSHISDRERSLSPAHFLGGHVGLRRKIADYVGVVVGRNLRTVRGIVEPLTKALADAYERGATEQPR